MPLALYCLVFSKSVCAITLWDLLSCLQNSWRTCTPSGEEHRCTQGNGRSRSHKCVRRQGSAPGGFQLPPQKPSHSSNPTAHPLSVASQHPKGLAASVALCLEDQARRLLVLCSSGPTGRPTPPALPQPRKQSITYEADWRSLKN